MAYLNRRQDAKYCCPFVLLQLQTQDSLFCFHVLAGNFYPKGGVKIIIEGGILHYVQITYPYNPKAKVER